MPFKSKKQWRKFFAMEAKGELPKGKAREWARETSKDYSDLPTRVKQAGYWDMLVKLGKERDVLVFTNVQGLDLEPRVMSPEEWKRFEKAFADSQKRIKKTALPTRVKQAGYWDMLVKLGAVDPTLKAHVERVARRMGFSAPSARDLERMFPKGWEKQSPSWQAQFEKSKWLKDQNSARIGGGPAGGTVSGSAATAGFRTVPLSRGAQRVSNFAKRTMRHHSPLLWGGLAADIAASGGAYISIDRKARAAGLSDKDTGRAAGRLRKHRFVGGLAGFGAGATIPYLANLSTIKGTGFRPVARRVGILNPLVMGFIGSHLGSLAGTPSGYVSARREIDKAAEEEPAYPDHFLLKRVGIPAAVGGAVSGAIGPVVKPAFMDWLKRRAPNMYAQMTRVPGGKAEQIISGLLAGAVTGAIGGLGTGYVADKLVKRQLSESDL